LNQAAPQSREFARRLLECEGASGTTSGDTVEVGFRVFEKLRRSLCTLAGSEGFRSLLARALTLAKAEAPALNAVHVKPDGTLAMEIPQDSDEMEKCLELLLAHLLDLLITFIGRPLTLGLVMESWPEALYDGINAETETET
jgi:hypothetical protein